MDRKLDNWHYSYISERERLTLIEAVLNNLPTYYLSLSIYKSPSKAAKLLETKMRNFLWKGRGEKPSSHLICRDVITLPEDKRGLSSEKITNTNTALLSKWLCRFHNKKDRLWRSLIEAKYATNLPGAARSIRKYSGAISPWFHIAKCSDLYYNETSSMVGSGSDTIFWYNNWEEQSPFIFFSY